MAFNEVMGVGWEPSQLGGLQVGEDTYTGNVPFPQNTETATISASRAFVLYAIVSISINNDIAYGSEVNANLFVGDEQLAKFVIPTGQTGQVIYETIPIGRLFYNPISARLVHGALAAGNASNYTVKITVFYRGI